MPVAYSVDHRRQRIHATGTGPVGVEDLANYIASRVRDGVYDYDQLIDLSTAQVDFASGEVMQVVRGARVHLSLKPIPFTAVVASAGSATYGVLRQLATLFSFEGASVQIVGSVDEGHHWLDQMQTERSSNPTADEGSGT